MCRAVRECAEVVHALRHLACQGFEQLSSGRSTFATASMVRAVNPDGLAKSLYLLSDEPVSWGLSQSQVLGPKCFKSVPKYAKHPIHLKTIKKSKLPQNFGNIAKVQLFQGIPPGGSAAPSVAATEAAAAAPVTLRLRLPPTGL